MGYRILVADDEKEIRDLLRLYLENEKYEVLEAEDGQQALDLLHDRKIDMVVNIPKNLTVGELSNGYKIRRAAVDLNVPLITNSRLAAAFIRAFTTIKLDDLDINSWEEYK